MNTAATARAAPLAIEGDPCRTVLPPLSLYVHLPWCVRKCPYCDFNSYEARGELPDEGYVDALLRDLDTETAHAQGRALQSVFLGGGTPSLFTGAAIARLIAGIRAVLPVAADAEITLEANPGALEAGRFAEFRAAGVNRLSIGIQSFRDAQLAALGRVHDREQAVRAIAAAREAGFENFNLDLMYALPGDDVAGSIGDLETAIEYGPAHLSWYQLTLEPNTAFHRRPPALPPEEVVAAIERHGRDLLARNAYTRYEVSAYARAGRVSAHNLNYWQFGDYLGIGAGAHGKTTLAEEAGILRTAKHRNPRMYMELAGSNAAVAVERIAGAAPLAVEFMMNALRLVEGIDAATFTQRTGLRREEIDAPVEQGVRRGWLSSERGRLRATPAGLEVLNSVLALFVVSRP